MSGIIQSPLAIAAWVLVVFEVASLTLAMTAQYPAWSVGRSNLEALKGKSCGLAEDVLVEQDPNAGMLAPVSASVADALGAGLSEAFTPNGIPADVRADPVMERPGDRSFVNDEDKTATTNQAGTEGGTNPAPGINGSAAQLPFNLDPARTPVLGSWRSGIQVPAQAAVGLVPATATGQGRAAAGGERGRSLRSPRGPGAVGHRRPGGQRPPRRVVPIRRCRGVAGLA